MSRHPGDIVESKIKDLAYAPIITDADDNVS